METSTTIYEQASYLFPTSENRLFLRDVVNFVELAAHPSVRFQFFVAILGFIITFFHLIILTRKSIMTTSVISIMIGIGICDFVAMIATIVASWIIYNENEEDECVPPTPLIPLYIYWIFINIRELVRRCSTWLGVVLALIRFINLKFWAEPKYRKYSLPDFGFRSFIYCFLGSIPFSVIYYFRYDIVTDGVWIPSNHCSSPVTSPITIWMQVPSKLFTDFNGLFGKFYMLVNGVISKILPCILLPLLTFLLIIELRRAEKVRITTSFMKRKKCDKTTGLVIFMTFSFFIVELPIGIVVVLQVAYTELGYIYLASYINHIFNAIFTLNAIIHCLICFLMSGQYRNTVGIIFGIKKKNNFITAVSTAQLMKIWEKK